jgi:hypothetical protein
MRLPIIVLLLFLALIAPVAAKELSGTCTVTFTGSSTLHDFDGTAACNPFALTVNEPQPGEPQLVSVVLNVPVADMSTGIDRRDRTMRAMFESELFPLITGRLAAAPLEEIRRQIHESAKKGSEFTLMLQIRNIEQPIKTRVTRLVDTTESFNVDLEFTLSLATFRLEPPAVLGFIRVADQVKVKVNVQFDSLGTPWPP